MATAAPPPETGLAPRPALGLRTLLLLIVAAATLPIAALVAVTSLRAQDEARQRQRRHLDDTARLVAEGHARQFDGTRQMLATLARSPSLLDPDLRDVCARYLGALAAQFPRYSTISFADAGGRIVCSSRSGVSVSVADRPYFVEAMKGSDFVAGGLLQGRVSGRKTLAFAVPVHDAQERHAGVLITGFDIGHLAAGSNDPELPAGVRVLTTDAAGHLLRDTARLDEIGAPLREPALAALVAAAQPGLHDRVDHDGRHWWHALQPLDVGGRRLWVMATAPEDLFMAPLRQRRAWQLGGLALVTLLAGLVAWGVGTHGVVRPARALRERIRGRATGVAGTAAAPGGAAPTAPRHATREMRDIDAAYTELDARLHQHERKLQGQLDRLHLLRSITLAAGERLDTASIEGVAADHVERRMPAALCAFARYDPVHGAFVLTTLGPRAAALQPATGLSPGAALDVGDNGLARALHGEMVNDSALAQRPEPLARQLVAAGMTSVALAPVQESGGALQGALLAARGTDEPFSSTDCEFLHQLAQHVAMAARHAQMRTELQAAFEELRLNQQQAIQNARLRAFGQMAGGIAHDINNAIAPVLLYADTLLERETTLSERARTRIEAIRHAIEDVAATVARLRELYRARDPASFAWVDVNELLRQVGELTRARWRDDAQRAGATIELRLELAAELPPVAGDRAELRDALINLVFNAVDAMPAGGTLALASAPARTAPGAPAVRIDVRDTGVGMDAEARAHCLEPFFSTKGERGSGLGLPMALASARRHGGTLDVVSAPGQGTCVSLVLACGEVGAAAPEPGAARAPARTLRLLVVDDDAAVRGAVSAALRDDGHHVVAVDGGRAALAAWQQATAAGEPFDVVVTDFGMPEVDGRAVAGTIKRDRPATPVIMLTGWGRGLGHTDAPPPGVDRVLAKPVRMRDLRDALARAIGDDQTQADPDAAAPRPADPASSLPLSPPAPR